MDLEQLAHRLEMGLADLKSEVAGLRHTVEEVRVQTTTTNGRVTVLEKWKVYTDGVKAGAGGLWQYAVAAAGFALVIVNLWVALSR